MKSQYQDKEIYTWRIMKKKNCTGKEEEQMNHFPYLLQVILVDEYLENDSGSLQWTLDYSSLVKPEKDCSDDNITMSVNKKQIGQWANWLKLPKAPDLHSALANVLDSQTFHVFRRISRREFIKHISIRKPSWLKWWIAVRKSQPKCVRDPS